MALRRANPATPCPICHKPDWCSFNEQVCICMRKETGSAKQAANGGWVFPRQSAIRSDSQAVRMRSELEGVPAWDRLVRDRVSETPDDRLAVLACQLGVSLTALRSLDVFWSQLRRAWGVPMRAEDGRVVGIRLRWPSGRKTAVKGSRNALFLPSTELGGTIFVTEGESDCAAALTIGVAAIGVPGAGQAAGVLARAVRGREVVIVTDRDTPGRRGGAALAQRAVLVARSVRVIEPPAPCSDLREWMATGAMIDELLERVDRSECLVPTVNWRPLS